MAFQVKVEYGGNRFATFLLENVSYGGLLCSIKKYCSSLAHLAEDKIRLRYRDEDGDMVNVCQADVFAFSEMLRTAKDVKDCDYKKIFFQATEIDSPCPHKMRRLDFEPRNPSTSDQLSCLEPKQLSFNLTTLSSTSFTQDVQASSTRTSTLNDQKGLSPLDSKQQEMTENLTVLRVQVATAKEELGKLNQQGKEYMTLASLRGCVCNNCHATGHTKTTCRNPPCSNIDSCKIKDKHPEHKMKVNELQREIKSLENQAAEEEANIKSLASAHERAKTSFFGLMRPRLKAQNLLKYGSGKRIHLDRDLLILQRALNNKVPDWGESEDWKLPLIIDQFQNSQLQAMMPKFL